MGIWRVARSWYCITLLTFSFNKALTLEISWLQVFRHNVLALPFLISLFIGVEDLPFLDLSQAHSLVACCGVCTGKQRGSCEAWVRI